MIMSSVSQQFLNLLGLFLAFSSRKVVFPILGVRADAGTTSSDAASHESSWASHESSWAGQSWIPSDATLEDVIFPFLNPLLSHPHGRKLWHVLTDREEVQKIVDKTEKILAEDATVVTFGEEGRLPAAGGKAPLILAPGLMGEQILGDLDRPATAHMWCPKHEKKRRMWPPTVPDLLLPGYETCYYDSGLLSWTDDLRPKQPSDRGVRTWLKARTDCKNFVDRYDCGYIKGYYDAVVKLLERRGYSPKTVGAAQFDWRLGVQVFLH